MCFFFLSWLSGHAQIQATLERSQGVQGVIQRLIFFDRVSAGGKEFTCTVDNCFLGIRDSGGNPGLVRLEKSSGVEVAPTVWHRLGGGRTIHTDYLEMRLRVSPQESSVSTVVRLQRKRHTANPVFVP